MVETNIIIYIIAAVLGIAGIAAWSRKEKKVAGINKALVGIIGVGLAVGLVAMQMGYLTGIGLSPLAAGVPGVPVTPTVQLTPTGICAVEDTTVTLSATDKATTTATGGSHKYRVNGAPALTVSDAGTLTASPGDTLSIMWFNNSARGAYFSDISTEVVPCAGTKTFSKELIANGTLTINVFNEEGNQIDTVGENETVAAGEVVTLDANIKGTYQKGLAHGGIMVVEWNNTRFDDVIISLGGVEVSVPRVYSITYGTTSSVKAYSIPAIIPTAEGVDKLEGSITINADDSKDPGVYDDIYLELFDNNYYINEDTGGSYDGPDVEDEDDVRTRSNSATRTIHVD